MRLKLSSSQRLTEEVKTLAGAVKERLRSSELAYFCSFFSKPKVKILNSFPLRMSARRNVIT